MKKIRVPGFSFHTEPFLMWMFSLGIPAAGITMAIVVTLIRKLFV